MPKRATSCVFFPRYKEGEHQGPGHLPRHISVTYEALAGLFHLPLKDAAREVGLCTTTFKKACRRFDMKKWPFRKGQRRTPISRSNVQTEGVVAAIKTLHQEHVCTLAVPTLQTPEMLQGKSAVTVSCTPPAWHNGSIDTSAFCRSFSRNPSSSSTVRASSELRQNCYDPFGAVFSSAAPVSLASLLQQASMALDTRSCDEAGHTGPAFQHKSFATFDAPSYIDSLTRGLTSIGVPKALPCSTSGGPKRVSPGSGRPEEGQPRERPCVEAVMDYLDGPLVGDFDFMFADEAGDATTTEGASLEGDDDGAES